MVELEVTNRIIVVIQRFFHILGKYESTKQWLAQYSFIVGKPIRWTIGVRKDLEKRFLKDPWFNIQKMVLKD